MDNYEGSYISKVVLAAMSVSYAYDHLKFQRVHSASDYEAKQRLDATLEALNLAVREKPASVSRIAESNLFTEGGH